ncbi:isochorismate synthase chloroplastic [Phtheirospermum japonicum]|uniref:Isochorismate synthase chloroplastic n=1 Tax=Phtheirospermum japonicum TaxID=374723 RepID=A0A830CZ51_9LAMI|nr:isochorismate synthase chloroplastic [Phtheirospermum japonicum]
MVPQIEFDEFEGSSMIAATVAWDNRLSQSYEQAIAALEATMSEISSVVLRLNGSSRRAAVLHQTHVPNKASWDLAVKRALDLISRKNSPLIKVVLARSSRVLTTVEIDPLEWLSRLQNVCSSTVVEPSKALRKLPRVQHLYAKLSGTLRKEDDEGVGALLYAGTGIVEGSNSALEWQELELKTSQNVCSSTVVEPSKALRKLPRVQHLYAKLSGTLRKEDDEFEILSFASSDSCCLWASYRRCAEMFDRGMYAGPVGWFGGAESEFAGVGALLYAGTGIVEGSNSALEWQELELKTSQGVGALLYAGTGIVEGSNSALEWQELELKTSQFTKLMKLEAPLQAMREKLEL